jgi:hypothetical protein
MAGVLNSVAVRDGGVALARQASTRAVADSRNRKLDFDPLIRTKATSR